jgi:putative membrane protein
MLIFVFAHVGAFARSQSLAIMLAAFIWVGITWGYHCGWKGSSSRRSALSAFAVGSAVAIGAVSPPLEHLAEDLVSAHMIQHVLLILVAAPLIAFGRPFDHLLRGLPVRARKRIGGWRRRARLTPATTSRIARPAVAWLSYALAVWFWHGSVPYQLAAGNEALHVLEHAVLFGAALGFWAIVLGSRPDVVSGFRLLMVFTTAFHTVLLGALLTFATSPWYRSYAASAAGFGLDPLADQQLAGLLMWIPGGLLYTGVGLWLLTDWIRGQDTTPTSFEDAFRRVPRSGCGAAPRKS